MDRGYVATSTVTIAASRERVWDVLTDPAAAREYMFGTRLETDWVVGSPIRWHGEWQGKRYEDHGTILDVVPARRLVCTHFSPLGGKPDIPENHHTLTWTLRDDPAAPEASILTLAQDNNATPEDATHSTTMWDSALAAIKALAERD